MLSGGDGLHQNSTEIRLWEIRLGKTYRMCLIKWELGEICHELRVNRLLRVGTAQVLSVSSQHRERAQYR